MDRECHRDYWTCLHCRSNLDYGERCDCQDKEKAAVPLQQDDSLENKYTILIIEAERQPCQ